jgi:hypothetical protein
LDKITILVKDLRSFTQLEQTFKASDFLAMCSQIRKLSELYESNIINPQEEAKGPEDFDWLFLDASDNNPVEVLPAGEQKKAKRSPVEVIGGANILKVDDPKEMAKVAKWVSGGKKIRLEKQYRMTEDGFKRAVWM